MRSLNERLEIAKKNGIRVKAIVNVKEEDFKLKELLEKLESENVAYTPDFGFLGKDQEGLYSVVVDPEIEKQMLKEYIIEKYQGRNGVFTALAILVGLPLLLTKIAIEQQEKIEDREILRMIEKLS